MKKTIKIYNLTGNTEEVVQGNFSYFKETINNVYSFICTVDFTSMLKVIRMSEAEYFRGILSDEEIREFKSKYTFKIIGDFFIDKVAFYGTRIKFNDETIFEPIFDNLNIENVRITDINEIEED